ncbi:hypothetical protein FXO38_15185 [Capsicum annuum]|nr:hypothetical protein FXO38_15185 [Capsicum annuum]
MDRVVADALKPYENLHLQIDDMEECVNNKKEDLSIPDIARAGVKLIYMCQWIVILALHDASDVFMEAAKLFKYSWKELGDSILFSCFAGSWLAHRDPSCDAVRKFLVLLKNGKDPKKPFLPLDNIAKKILIARTHTDDLGYQCGGWTSSVGLAALSVPHDTVLRVVPRLIIEGPVILPEHWV